MTKEREQSGIGSVVTFSIPLDISFADFLISKTSLSAGWLNNSEDGEKKRLWNFQHNTYTTNDTACHHLNRIQAECTRQGTDSEQSRQKPISRKHPIQTAISMTFLPSCNPLKSIKNYKYEGKWLTQTTIPQTQKEIMNIHEYTISPDKLKWYNMYLLLLLQNTTQIGAYEIALVKSKHMLQIYMYSIHFQFRTKLPKGQRHCSSTEMRQAQLRTLRWVTAHITLQHKATAHPTNGSERRGRGTSLSRNLARLQYRK